MKSRDELTAIFTNYANKDFGLLTLGITIKHKKSIASEALTLINRYIDANNKLIGIDSNQPYKFFEEVNKLIKNDLAFEGQRKGELLQHLYTLEKWIYQSLLQTPGNQRALENIFLAIYARENSYLKQIVETFFSHSSPFACTKEFIKEFSKSDDPQYLELAVDLLITKAKDNPDNYIWLENFLEKMKSNTININAQSPFSDDQMNNDFVYNLITKHNAAFPHKKTHLLTENDAEENTHSKNEVPLSSIYKHK